MACTRQECQRNNPVNNGGPGTLAGQGGAGGAAIPASAGSRIYQTTATTNAGPYSPAAQSCFHKIYLDDKIVLIDVCTNQQVAVPPGGNECLLEQDATAGSVWFADKCAMQQVLTPPAAAMEALAWIYKKTAAAWPAYRSVIEDPALPNAAGSFDFLRPKSFAANANYRDSAITSGQPFASTIHGWR